MSSRKSICLLAAGAALLLPGPASGQAVQRYLGEIILTAAGNCPRNSVAAIGQTLPINSNGALFSLIGSTYGGDGENDFQLPDLRGRAPIGEGRSGGLPYFPIGAKGGAITATLNVLQMPNHTHDGRVRASTSGPTTNNPVDATFPTYPTGENHYSNGNDNTAMHDDDVQISRTGGNQSFSIQNPYLAMRYCIVTTGIYPSSASEEEGAGE